MSRVTSTTTPTTKIDKCDKGTESVDTRSRRHVAAATHGTCLLKPASQSSPDGQSKRTQKMATLANRADTTPRGRASSAASSTALSRSPFHPTVVSTALPCGVAGQASEARGYFGPRGSDLGCVPGRTSCSRLCRLRSRISSFLIFFFPAYFSLASSLTSLWPFSCDWSGRTRRARIRRSVVLCCAGGRVSLPCTNSATKHSTV